RLQTLSTGSPMVFHTAPPQPYSNALLIWYAELVGGAEASQNGFGLRTPAKFVVRSAMDAPEVVRGAVHVPPPRGARVAPQLLHAELAGDGARRDLAVLGGGDREGVAGEAHAVAGREHHGGAGAELLVVLPVATARPEAEDSEQRGYPPQSVCL